MHYKDLYFKLVVVLMKNAEKIPSNVMKELAEVIVPDVKKK